VELHREGGLEGYFDGGLSKDERYKIQAAAASALAELSEHGG
jgi:hypothetical protein